MWASSLSVRLSCHRWHSCSTPLLLSPQAAQCNVGSDRTRTARPVCTCPWVIRDCHLYNWIIFNTEPLLHYNCTTPMSEILVIFTNSAPLGRVGHGVAMSVCAIECSFFLGLSLALRSHDQIPASHWSSLPPSLGNLETWKLRNSET